MRIRILRNLAVPFPPYKEGELVDTDDETAEGLCRRGLADRLPEPAELHAVPPESDLQTDPPQRRRGRTRNNEE